ncbi:hypothetical protein RRG08_032824 [Elysia crispata]|uniref:Uncharacterized protein n=1 Tax=Elysia crispata TaxID=231223 RepID=A0AAE1AG54_9GAST|nr:hypothetical protein RRG08_032824 [Elysia crispata]
MADWLADNTINVDDWLADNTINVADWLADNTINVADWTCPSLSRPPWFILITAFEPNKQPVAWSLIIRALIIISMTTTIVFIRFSRDGSSETPLLLVC